MCYWCAGGTRGPQRVIGSEAEVLRVRGSETTRFLAGKIHYCHLYQAIRMSMKI